MKLLIIFLPFIILYMAFAFVVWDIALVAHVDMVARWFFILLLVTLYLMLVKDN